MNEPTEISGREIRLPKDPAEAQRLTGLLELNRSVERMSENREDFRFMLTRAMADTEDFLRDTSRDRHYTRANNVTPYGPGGWLDA